MLNYIWAFMILVGVLYGCFTGHMAALSDAALNSSKEAISLCITMLGVMALWVGLMRIAQTSGLIAGLTQRLSPFLHFLFPRLDKDSKAMEYISTNVIANILGLGWACTPAGLKAMEELRKEENQGNTGPASHIASNEMCSFLILNISSLQLIPVNIIVYRSQFGSVNPAAIIVPAILATSVSTLAGILFIKIMDRQSLKVPSGRRK